MKFCILGYTKDQRTDTEVVYAQIGISEYLELVGEDFDRFEIQRKRQDPKKYTRLKEDTKKGDPTSPNYLLQSIQVRSVNLMRL